MSGSNVGVDKSNVNVDESSNGSSRHSIKKVDGDTSQQLHLGRIDEDRNVK